MVPVGYAKVSTRIFCDKTSQIVNATGLERVR